jgi:predicted outer membrane protein
MFMVESKSVRRLLAAALAGTILAAVPAGAALAAGPPVAPDANGQLPAGWTNTQWGPIGPADKALLQNVRRADLWEGDKASVWGMQKGTTPEIREAGKILHNGHIKLEADLRKVAAKLNVDLPTEPNDDQKSWLAEMQAASGTAFDEVWTDRLRAAHGVIYSGIASVRAGTRNSLVREYSEECEAAVRSHMDALEKTGLVEYNTLPTPNSPPPKKGAAAAAQGSGGGANSLIHPASSTSGGMSPAIIWMILIAAFGFGGAALFRVFRAR